MNLKALITRFAADEDGAVTVDWVVLTAGLVGLAAILGSTVFDGVEDAAGTISQDLIDRTSAAAMNGGGDGGGEG